MLEFAIQISGYAAMILSLGAYFMISDKNVVITLIFSAALRSIHLLLLGAYSGAFITVLFILRLTLSRIYKKNKKVFLLLIIGTFFLAYYTYQGIYSTLPILASLLGTYAFFYKKKIVLRIYMLVLGIIWGSYYYIIGSTSGLINEIIVQFIILSTIYRMLSVEGNQNYYTQKVKDILWKSSRPDYDRFVFIHDHLSYYKKTTGNFFQRILHYDLKIFFQKKKSKSLKKLSHSKNVL